MTRSLKPRPRLKRPFTIYNFLPTCYTQHISCSYLVVVYFCIYVKKFTFQPSKLSLIHRTRITHALSRSKSEGALHPEAQALFLCHWSASRVVLPLFQPALAVLLTRHSPLALSLRPPVASALAPAASGFPLREFTRKSRRSNCCVQG